MNILFTYITPFHPNKGGIGRVTDTLTREFQRRGHKVFYLIYACGITVRHEFDYPAPLTYLPSPIATSEENITAYHQYLLDNNIDIVINQSGNFSDSRLWCNTVSSKAKVISVLHQPPMVAYPYLFHELNYLRNNTFKEKLKRIARIILYPKIKKRFLNDRIVHFNNLLPVTDMVCALSESYFRDIDMLCSGYSEKYVAIPNPNSYGGEISACDFTKKKNEILWVGLFSAEKRPDRIIKAWKRLYKKHPDWTLVIVGYDKGAGWTEKLKRMARGIPNIRFEGYQDPREYYRRAKICVMTSNYEGWGMVLTEAMQYGCVPVAFNSTGAFSDIIADGKDGALVEPFSTKEYSSVLDNLISNDSLLGDMSLEARKSVTRFDIKTVADKWEAYFRQLKNSHD